VVLLDELVLDRLEDGGGGLDVYPERLELLEGGDGYVLYLSGNDITAWR
jgi:hypothetical protein